MLPKTSANQKSYAVIELFTSQGCSSCPPADRLLGKYADKENVIALSFHVDYWNRLGWKDPFSNPDFSKRQEAYASRFGASGVYTPQAIINGQQEMVGSDEYKIASAVKTFQSAEASAVIIIDEIKTDNKKALITYSSTASEKTWLNIALVQNKITTSIKAGENGGVQLTNYNVVRNFRTIENGAGKNTVSIDLVPDMDKKEFSVVLYSQDPGNFKISGAVKSAL